MTTKEIADSMLHRIDALTDSMGTDEGCYDAAKYAALEGLNNMIEECAKMADGVYCTDKDSQRPMDIAAAIRKFKADNPIYDLSR